MLGWKSEAGKVTSSVIAGSCLGHAIFGMYMSDLPSNWLYRSNGSFLSDLVIDNKLAHPRETLNTSGKTGIRQVTTKFANDYCHAQVVSIF